MKLYAIEGKYYGIEGDQLYALSVMPAVPNAATEELPDDLPDEPVRKSGLRPMKKTGKRVSYDREAVLADLESGMKPAEVAKKHKVSAATVYTVKSNAKRPKGKGRPYKPESPDPVGGGQKEEDTSGLTLAEIDERDRRKVQNLQEQGLDSLQVAQRLGMRLARVNQFWNYEPKPADLIPGPKAIS